MCTTKILLSYSFYADFSYQAAEHFCSLFETIVDIQIECVLSCLRSGGSAYTHSCLICTTFAHYSARRMLWSKFSTETHLDRGNELQVHGLLLTHLQWK